MIRTRSILSGVLALIVATGAALAQNQTCPRTDCPKQGQTCPRNGQCMRQGNAARGPAAMNGGMNRGMRRASMMKSNCPNAEAAATTATPQEKKK
jgi:hypothetical protein